MYKHSLPFKSYCQNGDRRSLFYTFWKQLWLVNKPLTYFLPIILFCDEWSSDIEKIFRIQIWEQNVRHPFCMPFYRHVIGIHISGNSIGQIQTTITLSISIEKIQNLCSNSSSKCLLYKTFGPRLKITYSSKVKVEIVREGHFSTHFHSD